MKNKRPNCLLVLPRNIFPTLGGYAIKNKALVKILGKQYMLNIVVISEKPATQEELSFYKENCESYKFFYYPKWRFFFNAIVGVIGKQAIQVRYFYFKEVQKYIDKQIPQQDIVIGALIRSMKYLEQVGVKVKVFDMVDSIAINYQKSKDNVKSIFWKLIYNIEAQRLFRSEESWIKNSDVTFLFNWKEADYWKQYGNVCLLPHGVNEDLFSYDKYDSKYSDVVSFIGKMDYQPNVDAVLWYLRNVHSEIGDNIPFYIVGACPTKEVLHEANKYPNVIVTGFVDDPFIIIKSSLAVVAPMQTGAGIQNKILESMGLGKAVITTTLAAMPILGAVDGLHLAIADDSEDFIRIIKQYKDNKEVAESIGKAAKDFIMDNYTWTAYGKKYCGEIQTQINLKTSNDNKK